MASAFSLLMIMKLKLNDEEVIRQYLNTSPNDCFETLYDRYVSKVYSRCLYITKDSEKAQDYTQDIFIKMFARLDRFQERSSFSTWLYSISHNYCMDQLRMSKRMTTDRLTDDMDYRYSGTDESEEKEYSLQQLTRVMNSLPPQEAMLLRMKYQDGLEIRQIAQQLNLNDSAVKMRLKRSRDKVRQLCNEAFI